MSTPEGVTPLSDSPAVDRAPHTSARGDLRRSTPAREQLVRLAQEFEATLLNEMLSGWRQSLFGEDGRAGADQGALADMVGTEFGRAMSRQGGLGIADVLVRALEGRFGEVTDRLATPLSTAPREPSALVTRVPAQTAGVLAAVAASPHRAHGPGDAASGASAGSATADLPPRLENVAVQRLAGAVTSGFGWRSDPISGRPQFHAGADLRMAYGQEVSTVARGRVTFAGDRAGYGLTVVVDHGDGVETRYAHLSSTAVKPGDVVEAGGVIARSGNSGRSTGPHLHVELIRHGQRQNPAVLMAALKNGEAGADSHAYRFLSASDDIVSGRSDQE